MIRVSEIFASQQGEGKYAGSLCVWVRLFGCNLQCRKFYADDMDKPATAMPYDDKTWAKQFKTIYEVPVLSKGCDSAYSWHPSFKHLVKDYTTSNLVSEILDTIPWGTFGRHEKTSQKFDLAITGGEPMLQQDKIIDIAMELVNRKEYPHRIQIETNGTVELTNEMMDLLSVAPLSFNISPKLFNVAGEQAWMPRVVAKYLSMTTGSSLKFVVNNTEECWRELDQKVQDLSNCMDQLPEIYVMPVGATKEQQENSDVISKIAERAMNEGYLLSGRLHCSVYGNVVGK